MAAIFYWQVISFLPSKISPDVPTVTITGEWQCLGIEGDKRATVTGTVTDTIPKEEFESYKFFTEAALIEWCWANGGVNKAQVEAQVQAQLDQ